MSSWSKTKALWSEIQTLNTYLKEYETPEFKSKKLSILRLNRDIVRKHIKSDDVKMGSIQFNKACKVMRWIEKEIRIEEMQV